jgi:hypothetical protein
LSGEDSGVRSNSAAATADPNNPLNPDASPAGADNPPMTLSGGGLK